jgi:ribosomal protein L34
MVVCSSDRPVELDGKRDWRWRLDYEGFLDRAKSCDGRLDYEGFLDRAKSCDGRLAWAASTVDEVNPRI